MKEIIGFVYKELKDNFVNTVRSEPLFRVDLEEDGYVTIRNYKTKNCYMCLGNPSTEIKRKRLVNNWASNKKITYVNIATWESIRRKYGVIHKTETEKVKELKTIVYNARDFASKLEQLNGFLEKTASNYVSETCRDAANMFRTIAYSLEKYCK